MVRGTGIAGTTTGTGTAEGATPEGTAAVDHATWMRLATEEYRRLDDLLRGLDADDWARPTECPGWDVHAMVAHLAGAAEGNARLLETARQAAVGRRRFPRPTLVDSINEVQIADRAGRTPAELVDELADAGRRGVAARARIPRALRAVRIPTGPPLGITSLGHLFGCIYTRDAWMHRVDLSRATGRPLVVTPEHDGRLVADVVDEWARGHDADFDLTLTGPAGLHRARGTGGEQLTLDAVEFARAVSGREQGTGLLAIPVPF